MMISVCLATFNGGDYIKEQLESILVQISSSDEVVICDDGSIDETLKVIKSLNDRRIRVFENSVRLGHVRNFEKTLELCHGEFIFLSDQDDVWLPGRVKTMMSVLNSDSGYILVASNFDLIDRAGNKFREFRELKPASKMRTINSVQIFAGRMPYYGCTFLFKKRLLDYCLPIPSGIESHDIWIALTANVFGKVANLTQATLQHRIHDRNVTAATRRKVSIILRSRMRFLSAIVVRLFKIKVRGVYLS